MRRIFFSITFVLLPFITAIGQTRVEPRYTQICDDSTSCFYTQRGICMVKGKPVSIITTDKYNICGPYRIMTDEDTLVCFVGMSFGYRGYKNSVGTVNLKIEDQHPYSTNPIKKHIWSAHKDFRKLKRHIKIKVKAYHAFDEPSHTKKLTAYIDFRPFEGGRGNEVHFKLKRGKVHYTAKEGFSNEKIRVKQEKLYNKKNKWLKEHENKLDEWVRKFYQKYYIINP